MNTRFSNLRNDLTTDEKYFRLTP